MTTARTSQVRKHQLALGVTLVVVAAAAVAGMAGWWADNSLKGPLRTESGSELAGLEGPDQFYDGPAFVSLKYGRDPQTLLRNVPEALVGKVEAAAVVPEPEVVDLSDADIPYNPGPGEDPKGGPPTKLVVGNYITRYTVTIEEPLKASALAGSRTVDVYATGAVVNGREIASTGIPIYRIGERYLFFLISDPYLRPEGDYFPASGVKGAYLLKDGQVYQPLGEEGSWIRYEEQPDEAALLEFLRDAPKEPASDQAK